MDSKYHLQNWPTSFKTLASCFVIATLFAYAIGLVKIYEVSSFGVKDAAIYYAGDDAGEESLNLPQSYGAMLSIAHVHSFSQPVVFVLLGLIFLFSYCSERKKTFFVLTLFLAMFLGNFGPWLVKYGQAQFIWSMILSQFFIGSSLISMAFISLKQLWCSKE